MRIMILGDDQSPHTIKWVNALSDGINTICLVSFHKVDKGLYHENVKIVTIDVIRENVSNIDFLKFGYLRLVKIVRKEIKEFKPDIVHAYYASSYGLIGALSRFRPFVISVWGSDVFEFPKKSFIHKFILKYNLRKADYIQSTSLVMAKELSNYTDKDIIVVPFGIDMEKYKPLPEIKKENEGTIVIGTIKWLREIYGINYLIDAFYLLTKKYPDKKLKLLIVGGGPRLMEYKILVKQYNIDDLVEFVGAVPISKTRYYHNKIDIFVALSLRESFGVSALEAASCSVPAVVSNVGGLPEVVENGKTGFIVESMNPQAAADAISKLIDDPDLKESMGVNARKFVKRKYDWNYNVKDQIQIYERIKSQEPISNSRHRTKVCHISTVHSRYDVRIFHKECSSLAKVYEVHLIVADGKGDEILNDVHIHDIGVRQESRLNRVRIDAQKAFQLAKTLSCELYHFHDPELITIARKLQKTNAKVIYDVHEDLPRQIYGKPYMGDIFKPGASKIIEYFENKVAKQLDYIVTATPFIRERFSKINKNTVDINNFPILSENLKPIAFSDKSDALSYVGGIFENRGVYELIESLKISKVKLHLAGEFETDAFYEKCKSSEGWKYVDYYGFLDRKEVVKLLNKSKVGIVSLYPLRNYLDSLPIKMFEYMLAGIPVIASDFPYWKRIVEEVQCGVNVNPKDPEAIAEKTKYLMLNPDLAQKMGDNGRRAVLEKYNWSIEEEKLYKIYKELL